MKDKWKRILSTFLAFTMVFSVGTPVQTTAGDLSGGMMSSDEHAKGLSIEDTKEEEIDIPDDSEEAIDSVGADSLEFSADNKYAIAATSTELAMNITGLSWTNHAMVQAVYHADSNKLEDDRAQFIISPAEDQSGLDTDEVKVMIQCCVDEQEYPLRTESNNDYAFADNEQTTGRYDGSSEMYIIKKTGENEGKIRAVSNNRYATADNGELRFSAETTVDNAEVFKFASSPSILNMNISFEHVKSGKYIRTYQQENVALTVDGAEGDEDTIFSKAVFGVNNTNTVNGGEYATVSFVSKKYGNGLKSVVWNEGADASKVLTSDTITGSGWETIRVIANGDGTVSFKDACWDEYITVENGELTGRKIKAGTKLTDNEKFIIHTEIAPKEATNLSVNKSTRTQSTLELSWKNPECLYTGMELYQKKTGDVGYTKVADIGEAETYTVEGLSEGTEYSFKLRTVLNNGTDVISSPDSEEVTATTRAGKKPATPANLHITEKGNGDFEITWDAAENAKQYKILRAPSMYGEYTEVTTVDTTAATVTPADGSDKYSNYYRIVAVNMDEESDESVSASLESELFGDHTIIFAETDDVTEINRILMELFDKQNDYDADAQFKGEQWQVYFKPGDYTKTSCMYLGFYTSFNGLGKTPYDVKLNNIAIPAYLPNGALGGNGDNATCNFWRSTENLSIINTGNEQGKAGYGSYRPDSFNWAVAQAAPLRRVYSERPVAYDWNYGWASGGYVADCYINGSYYDENKGENYSAGTWSGQQFFTRNSKMSAGTYGTTLNNFFMGVEAPNNLTAATGEALKEGNGYTNWGIAAAPDGNGKKAQQVVTEITNTPKISEKPFLYLDGGEYKIFVPKVQENTRGISWGEGKANDGMGEGTSLSLDAFYIAKPTDTAAEINRQIAAGKNIYFTPGTYHAEVPIEVNRENAILLGTGMTSIIPDNGEMAMRVADKDGIRIEGLIFDAGLSSEYLLQVGTKGQHNDHSANPIVLQDLFFRVGGTTDVLTKSDDALEINSDDVIGDHFWIWRADHGAGVEWYGNESKHGLIVNGDDVNCYALFNEHFQEYHTLWNGENGATYFYQNETCYDPISQDAWMSHNGKVKGYSSYKVSNDVKNHYAVGLGVYNVFIYTGPSYDGSGIGIELENAIEVPNSPNVLVENACTQTFANDGLDMPLQRINHIINGVGGSVSSGTNQVTGEKGESWSRKFLLYYNNGKAKYGKETNPATFNYEDGNDSRDERGQFIGTVTEDVEAPEDESIYIGRIQKLYDEYSQKKESDYTAKSWANADMATALSNAKAQIDAGKEAMEGKYSQSEISAIQSKINIACTRLEAAAEKLVYVGQMGEVSQKYASLQQGDYTAESWAAFTSALAKVNALMEESKNADPQTKKEIYALQLKIDAACTELEEAAANLKAADKSTENNQQNQNSSNNEVTASNNDTGNTTTNNSQTPNNENKTKKIPAKKLTLNTKKVYIVKGKSLKIKAVMTPSNTTDKLTWSSSKKSVATVKNGKIKAKKTGSTKITVKTSSGKKVTCKVYVVKKAKKSTSIKLNKKKVTIKKGNWVLLSPKMKPAKTTDTVKWKSSNKKVASVDSYGFVTGKKKGKATITATTKSGKKVKCKVTVK